MSEPQRSKRQATYDDVLRAPPNRVAEILDGKLCLSPRQGGDEGIATIGIRSGPFHRATGSPLGPGGWWVLGAVEVHVGSRWWGETPDPVDDPAMP